MAEKTNPHYSKLHTEAIEGTIACNKALVSMRLIKPFSSYSPTIGRKYRAEFLKDYLNLNPPVLHLYYDEKTKKFIMSADYQAYAMYKEVNAESALCIILGECPELPGVTVGESIKLTK